MVGEGLCPHIALPGACRSTEADDRRGHDPLDRSSDGGTYLSVRDDDLRPLGFDRVEAVHPMT